MNKRNLFIRITAIVLCAIMVLSVVTVALYAFAAEPTVAAAVETGSANNTWIIVAAAIAVLVVVACVVVPKFAKKK